MIAADYPFLDLMWTMIVFFLWVLWIWLLFTVFADIFRWMGNSDLPATIPNYNSLRNRRDFSSLGFLV